MAYLKLLVRRGMYRPSARVIAEAMLRQMLCREEADLSQHIDAVALWRQGKLQ